MDILTHVCCAPCLSSVHEQLDSENHTIVGYWFNPNIHPFTEHKKRLHTLQRYTALKPVDVIYDTAYDLPGFIDGLLAAMKTGGNRCEFCYKTRLRSTAKKAAEIGCDAFSTTLTLSKYQSQTLIKQAGEQAAEEFDVSFYYKDFRPGWKRSVELSHKLELYRQPYCGCIFSEFERYAPENDQDSPESQLNASSKE